MGLLHFHSEIPRIQASVKAEADESAEAAAAAQYVEFKFRWRICMYGRPVKNNLMPYPCSHFYFDIKFGDRLYSKENRPGSPFLF